MKDVKHMGLRTQKIPTVEIIGSTIALAVGFALLVYGFPIAAEIIKHWH